MKSYVVLLMLYKLRVLVSFFRNFQSLLVRTYKKSQTQLMLIIEMIFKTKQDLGWTRYTPRLIYLLLLCYVIKQCCYFFLNLV
ncbi:hypothetical protein HanPI659440_Chr10g0363341 [Helianthus annuus]|nr:hypothetical protein HanPI659440_Chr10g0363341 [Helianthus annuus]